MTGNAYGGIYVNQKFESLLSSLFGIPLIQTFRSQHPAAWLALMQYFEQEKRADRALEGKTTRIVLPRQLMKMVHSSGKDMADRLAAVCANYDVKISEAEELCLSPKAMRDLFHYVTDGIVSHMKTLFRNPALHGINCLILVGGFSDCQLLQEKIREAVPRNCKLLVPETASIAIVKGAVMYAKIPDIVLSRMMTTTYGFKMYVNFDSDIHRRDKWEMVEGVAKCKDIFVVIAKQNESVKQGETKRFGANPLRSDQKQVSFEFFTSTNPNVKYVTEPSVRALTTTPLVVDSPHTSKGINRDIELCLNFGGTEIKATAHDKSSGNTKVLYLKYWN